MYASRVTQIINKRQEFYAQCTGSKNVFSFLLRMDSPDEETQTLSGGDIMVCHFMGNGFQSIALGDRKSVV